MAIETAAAPSIIEEVEVAIGGRDNGQEKAACAAEDWLASVIEVLDELADGNPDSQARHGKVMTPQPKQRHADQDGKDGGRQRSQREGEEERPPRLGDEHPGRVRADAEESHVAERRVAGETADDVPGG